MNKIVKLITTDRKKRNALLAEFKRIGDPISDQALNEWKKLPKGVPPKRVAVVSKVIGLPPHVIRPDVFPRP